MTWICPKCETENPDRLKVCEVCDSPRESSPADKLKEKLKKKYFDIAYRNLIRYHYGLLDSADKGNANAQYSVAEWFFARGNNGVSDKNSSIAVYWYSKAANKGHINAQIKLALCYEEGRGIVHDKEESMKWYKKAADQGDDDALKKYIKLKYNSKAYEQVIKYRLGVLSTADRGNNDSQFSLGEWFRTYNFHATYREEAFAWYTKAAKNGHVEAMYRLGECYETGFGVYSNITVALDWYKKAARSGCKKACLKLGEDYLFGRNTTKDVAESVKWFKMAGDDISGETFCTIGNAFQVGDSVPIDMAKAIEYYKKAADKGNMVAQYNLGICFENGNGVEKDILIAKYWYEKAFKQGYSKAQPRVARILKEIRKRSIRKHFLTILGGIMIGVAIYTFTDHIPKVWPNTHPTNLIICIVIGYIVTLVSYED